MGAIAAFSSQAFLARYPEFSTVASLSLQLCFNEATLFHANDGTGPINDPGVQLQLLNMATAHIVALNFGVNGQAPTQVVGRLASGAEGSVNGSFEMKVPDGTAQYWNQTKYGAAYWAATNLYRRFSYRANPSPVVQGGRFGVY